MRLVVALALVVGCNKPAENATSKCATAASSGADAMIKRAHDRLASAQLPAEVRTRLEERTKKLDEIVPRLKALITNRCVDDKWPADVINCYSKISSMDELRACRGKLTPEQQATIQREELDLFTGVMGPPGFGPQAAAQSAAAAATSPEITRLETEVRALNERLAAAQKQIDAAASDADRTVAKQSLLRLQQELAAANKALEAARADAAAGSASMGSAK